MIFSILNWSSFCFGLWLHNLIKWPMFLSFRCSWPKNLSLTRGWCVSQAYNYIQWNFFYRTLRCIYLFIYRQRWMFPVYSWPADGASEPLNFVVGFKPFGSLQETSCCVKGSSQCWSESEWQTSSTQMTHNILYEKHTQSDKNHRVFVLVLFVFFFKTFLLCN